MMKPPLEAVHLGWSMQGGWEAGFPVTGGWEASVGVRPASDPALVPPGYSHSPWNLRFPHQQLAVPLKTVYWVPAARQVLCWHHPHRERTHRSTHSELVLCWPPAGPWRAVPGGWGALSCSLTLCSASGMFLHGSPFVSAQLAFAFTSQTQASPA